MIFIVLVTWLLNLDIKITWLDLGKTKKIMIRYAKYIKSIIAAHYCIILTWDCS